MGEGRVLPEMANVMNGRSLSGQRHRLKISMVVLVCLASAACSGSADDREHDRLTQEVDAHLKQAEAAVAQADAYIVSRQPSAVWTEFLDHSRLTDDDGVALTTQSQPYLGADGETRAELVLRCKEKHASVYIKWGEFLGHDNHETETKDIVFRLDAGAPEKKSLGVSTDNESLGWWESKQAESIIRRLSKSSKMVARVTPYGEADREAEFNVAGLGQFLPRFLAACPSHASVSSK